MPIYSRERGIIIIIRIAVCDDEQKIVNLLCDMIKDHLPDCEIEEYNFGTELLDENEKFDIYFLDICMRDLDGMETAKRIRESNEEALIVFVTGEKGYVYDAFDVRAFHYLFEYSCAMKSHFRKSGNQMSGKWKSSYASLLA